MLVMMRSADVVLHLDLDFEFTGVVKEQLSKCGIQSHSLHAPNMWREGIARLNAGIILLEANLGEWNGFEILEKIRKLDGDRRVILLTSQMNTSTVIQAMALGADYCFFKSETNIQELVDAIHTLQFRRFHWTRVARVAVNLRKAQREAGDVVPFYKQLREEGSSSSLLNASVGGFKDSLLSEAFPRFLLESVQIPLEALVKATEYSDRQRPLLGQVALELHKLDMRQIFSIVEEQTTTREPFGQVAVRMGLLTPEDVELLLRTQSQRRLDVGAALVTIGAITQQQLETYQADFRKYTAALRGDATHLDSELHSAPVVSA
jgi:ActR/RegA family two-component response regulator